MIQLLSLSQWYHFAYMVISIALLGFGAAGTVLSVWRERLLKHEDRLVPLLMIVSGFTQVTAVQFSQHEFARFDSYLLFFERKQWLALLINYVLYFLPFLFGALALGIVFVKYVSEIGKLYFSDLAGAAVGAVVAAALAWHFRPAVLPVIIALMAMGSGLVLMSKQNKWTVMLFAAIAVAFCFYRIIEPFHVRMSQYKSLSRTMNLPAAQIIIEKPGPYGFVQVVSAEALRYAPGLSLSFTGEIPVRKAVFNNGDWVGPVVSWHRKDTMHLLDFTTSALSYAIGERDRVLVLHAGTGLNVSHAVRHGAVQVDAVESHRGIADLLMNELAPDNDSLFYNHAVTMHITEPRTFLLATDRRYDLIELPMVGAFGGTVGLYAMREEYILTKESFIQLWNRLQEDGVLSVTSWMDYPFRNPLKLVATFAELMDELKLPRPDLHFVAVRSWGTITFLLKRSAFSPDELNQVRAFCETWSFDPVFLPGLQEKERTRYNGLNDMSFFLLADKLLYGDREKVYEDYDFNLKPATDDKPYFSQFLRWQSIPRLSNIYGTSAVPFLEIGLLISAITFLQISLLAVALIILPLFKIGWKGRGKLWVLLYFSAIGMGYMLLEIVFIQKFIVFFGNPVYAVSLVIAVMLLASGAGSYASSSLKLNRSAMQGVLVAIVLALVVCVIFLSTVLPLLAGYSMLVKLAISIIVIAFPAFFMGIPFPTGLRICSKVHENNIPWAWGINGCTSVISASLASLLAVEAGFTVVIIVATFSYLICLLSLFLLRSEL